MKLPKKKLLVIGGQTATGKSDLAVEKALELDGEVISADSRQVYRGLDVGSNKITLEETRGVPHHLLDVVDPGASFSVREYQRLAQAAIDDIHNRGKLPIITGGTGYYIDAVVFDTTFPEVPTNHKLREELEGKSTNELFMMLMDRDPRRAETIDPHNHVRLIRALEIVDAVGNVPEIDQSESPYDYEMIILEENADTLKERIRARLERRADDILTEVEGLVAQGVDPMWLQGLGLEYRHGTRWVEGEIDRTAFIQEAAQDTWQYARRQRTWFRKYT